MTKLYQDRFMYQLINEQQVKQEQNCTAIAISNDNSFVVASCWNMIKVFQFKSEIMKQVNIINGHDNRITFLGFYKNSIVSSNWSQNIKIWSMSRIYSQKFLWKIQAHEQVILSLVINSEQNCIISSGSDKKIKFWKYKNGWLCTQTIKDHDGSVFGLSLNEKGNKLISCSNDKKILVMVQEQTENLSKWVIIQQINVQKEGYRLCLIDDNLFTFQQSGEKYMDIYELDDTNQFVKTKCTVIKGGKRCDCVFPQQYIKSKKLLVNKNGYYINLIRRQEDNSFRTEMSINLQAQESIYGQMSQDGQFLFTWDSYSKFIQIRKYKSLN